MKQRDIDILIDAAREEGYETGWAGGYAQAEGDYQTGYNEGYQEALADAHSALTSLQNAEDYSAEDSGGLEAALEVVEDLINA